MARIVALGALPLLVVVSSCATATTAKPDGMSAEEHREAARQHRAQADAHQAQYYEEFHALNAPIHGLTTQQYDPEETHLRQVTTHRMRAARHEAAAQELEARHAASPSAPNDTAPSRRTELD